MAIQLSVAARNARLDAIETTVGTSAQVMLFSLSPPGSCSLSDTGTLLATFQLASDWASAASNGAKAFSNTPLQDTSADGTGTVGHFRLKNSAGTVVHMQGTCQTSGASADMTIDNPAIVSGQTVQITSWTLTDGNA
jgi:hypothetical protein